MFRSAPIRLALLLAGLLPLAAASTHAGETRAFVTTTDFSSGELRRIDLDTRVVIPGAVAEFTDTRVRASGGRVYVLNRLGQDNVHVVDPATLGTVIQFSTGAGSNPSDIVVMSPTKAYVSLYERTGLLIVNPTTGATLGSIALGAFADADGIPEMDRMIRVEHRLFVSLQRVDRNHGFVPTDTSLVAVIDTDADTVVDANPSLPGVQAIVLTGKNPITSFAFDRSTTRLLIGCVGSYQQLDGGIEWIDPITLQSLGYAVTETALGGDVTDVVWNRSGHSYAIVSDASFQTSLVAWSATTGTLLGPVLAESGFYLSDAELDDRGELYVCDNNFAAPGVRVYRADVDTLLAGPIDTDLPPYQITFDQQSEAITAVPPVTPSVALSAPWPNPARRLARSTLSLARAQQVEVGVFDVGGRRVRSLVSGVRPAGALGLEWDLTDTGGRRVDAGVYIVRARLGERTLSRKLVVVP